MRSLEEARGGQVRAPEAPLTNAPRHQPKTAGSSATGPGACRLPAASACRRTTEGALGLRPGAEWMGSTRFEARRRLINHASRGALIQRGREAGSRAGAHAEVPGEVERGKEREAGPEHLKRGA